MEWIRKKLINWLMRDFIKYSAIDVPVMYDNGFAVIALRSKNNRQNVVQIFELGKANISEIKRFIKELKLRFPLIDAPVNMIAYFEQALNDEEFK